MCANEPDLAQTAAVACCLLDIPFTFSGLGSLHIKETDRVQALITELKKLGFLLEEVSHGVLEYAGKRCETSADVEIATYEDHRMAMAFAPAAIKTGSIVIQDPSVVTKSYPDFFEDLKAVSR